jgi:hypothetical protein
MKKALFIGNCHNNGLIHFLSFSKEFTHNFTIKQYANWELIESGDSIPVNDIKSADLFIHQPLPPVHGCYSTDPSVENSIGSFVKESCLKISYPYVYCSSLWPIVQAAAGENRWFGNKVIDDLILNGLSESEILEKFENNQIDWNYKNRFNETINILKEKEKVTDLKISDFIIENIQNQILFLIPQHPTSIIFLELTNQIMKKMNMNSLDNSIIKTINDANLPDSTYGIPDGIFPMDESIVENDNFSYSVNYSKMSKQFYSKRIKDYIKMNY